MARESLTAEPRDASGKSPVARRLRSTGKVPGIIYTHGEDPIPFATSALDLAAVVRHGATLVDVNIDGATHTTMIKDYQVHPTRGSIVHVDMQKVRMDETIRTTVQVNLVGEAPGTREGGVLGHITHELNVECRPGDIPEHLDIDISDLHINQSLTLADISVPEGVIIMDDVETTIVTITPPAVEEPEPTAAAAEGDEAAALEGAGEADSQGGSSDPASGNEGG